MSITNLLIMGSVEGAEAAAGGSVIVFFYIPLLILLLIIVSLLIKHFSNVRNKPDKDTASICPECGTRIIAGKNFCTKCGAKIKNN